MSSIEVFVINLDYNKERLNKFTQYYNNSDIKDLHLQRFSAVNGRKLELDYIKSIMSEDGYNGLLHIEKTGIRENESQLSRGMIGCYLSHVELYKILQSKEDDTIMLIFEDDAGFNKDLLQNGVIKALELIPDDWDIILLGYINLFDYDIINDKFLKIRDFWGLQGYLINKRGADKILQHAFPIDKQIDIQMSKLAKQDQLNIFGLIDNKVEQTSVYSDVQMNVTQPKVKLNKYYILISIIIVYSIYRYAKYYGKRRVL